jgi:hypothetical protein
LSPPRARPEVSQCLAPYTSKLRWWLRAYEVRCGTKECPPPPPTALPVPPWSFTLSPPPKDESIALCEDCKTGVVYFKATVYGLVSVCGEAKGMFRRQGLKSPMVMVYRASWKHRGCFSKLFLTTMALGFSSFHLVQDLTFFYLFPPLGLFINNKSLMYSLKKSHH